MLAKPFVDGCQTSFTGCIALTSQATVSTHKCIGLWIASGLTLPLLIR